MMKDLLRKWSIVGIFVLNLGFLSLDLGFWRWEPGKTLQAQVGIDFNRGESSGTINLATFYRAHHNLGGIVPGDQNSMHLTLNGFFWLSNHLSSRFTVGAGLPLVGPENLTNSSEAAKSLFFYEGEYTLRFTLLKASNAALMLGVLIDASEGHSGSVLLFNPEASNSYLQTGLGFELEMALALGLEYLFYLRLKVPVFTYNSMFEQNLEWGFYPRQGSLELAFLFHKGPSFQLSKATRNMYFGPFYRFDARVLSVVPDANLILSHTVGVTYYVKPPF
ncbi:hypothetical protein P0082_09845 [Candidatus Haliotispira prima]|uniref:Uncharacterized protein n=1 Tax=Candidatus Haliotispira prima TaxID=3034016 RepID=A0ABY8MFR9_9SPIO|nr:hypothetical protein P0082_09845 [Candidatus Haliotispira prima]